MQGAIAYLTEWVAFLEARKIDTESDRSGNINSGKVSETGETAVAESVSGRSDISDRQQKSVTL